MKRGFIWLILLLTCGTLLSCTQETHHEYLIDLVIKNEEQLPVASLSLGMVENGAESPLTDAKPGEGNEFHFAVSYDPECEFVLSGEATGLEIQKCYFDLKQDSTPEEAQQHTFYMKKSGNTIIIKESKE